MASNAPNRLPSDRPSNWLDRMIEDARERGDFDDLPGHGEPLKLPPASAAPSEYDLAFTMLSNAGFAPYWIELGKDAEKIEQQMSAFRDQAAHEMDELRDQLESASAERLASEPDRKPWWQRIWSGDSKLDQWQSAAVTRESIERRRSVLREQHAHLAETLDAKLATFHAAMPRELWHVQRPRNSPEDWAAVFDRACPPVLDY